MHLQGLRYSVCALLLAFIPKCYAPPIQQDSIESTNTMAIISILRTVMLGYMTHVVTVRSISGVTELPTLYRRILAFIYPSSGIGLALSSIYKAIYGERVLGVAQYSYILRKYEKENNSKSTKGDNNVQTSTTPTLLQSPDISESRSTTENIKDKIDKGYNVDSETLLSNVIQLRDRLMKDLKASGINVEKDNNGPYLAAFLHAIGPERAKKTKHCILNGSLTYGSNSNDISKSTRSCRKTEDITVVGPGASCRYQHSVEKVWLHFSSTDVIDQLEMAYHIDDTSYVETFVTIGQLLFTTIECMNIDGEKWVKVIIIIYTAMSILQTVSLVVLHKQISAFSVKYYPNPFEHKPTDYKVEIDSLDESYIESNNGEKLPRENKGTPLTVEERKEFDRLTNNNDLDDFEVGLYSMVLGTISSLLLGIWAGYNKHTLTEWLVLAWVLSPIFLTVLTIPVMGLGNQYDDIGDLWLELILGIFSVGAIGCLMAATIIGYLPK
ncbi:hypothetical protein F4703DRAFT_1946149 [Phycomyces blakesleeanus]